MTTTDKNVLIAQFMGGRQVNTEQVEIILDGNRVIRPISILEYHTSWDWIIPAVQKCFTLNFDTAKGFREYSDVPNTLFDPYRCSLDSDIELIHTKLVEFILWYNQNKPT